MSKKIVEIPFPMNNSYEEQLRFCVQTMECDDPNLKFMVGMWSYCIANDGLTEKQEKSVKDHLIYYLKKAGYYEQNKDVKKTI